ncbi:MAG: carboxypeptidase-like regulatory domain-containing protein, partial [Terriglobales bacterium]
MKLDERPLLLLAHVAKSVIRHGVRTFPALNRRAIGGMVIILASCLGLTAQNVVLTGSLGGRVTDSSGALVPGASVVVRNLATGVEQTADT